MGDTAIDCKERHTKIDSMWSWFHTNGNKGAGERLQALEDVVNGKEPCRAMEEISEHKSWHEKMSGRRWELYIGFIIVIVAQILSSIFLR